MLKMNKRGKDVDWSKLANASPKPKRLHLEEDGCRRKQLQYTGSDATGTLTFVQLQ